MNDNEGKVCRRRCRPLHSNIPRSTRCPPYSLTNTNRYSPPLFGPRQAVFARLSRTMENETRSRVPTDLSLHSARFITNFSFSNCSVVLLSPLCRVPRNFCRYKRISRNLICSLVARMPLTSIQTDGNVSSRVAATIR